MADGARRSVLDRPAARLAALGVFGLCVAALVYIHRDDIWPPPAADVEGAANDPAARCVAERFAQIDAMVDEGVIGPEQVELFKNRAAAFCQAQAEGGGPGPGWPDAAPAVRPPGTPAGGGPALPPEALRPATPGGGAPPPPGPAVRPPGN